LQAVVAKPGTGGDRVQASAEDVARIVTAVAQKQLALIAENEAYHAVVYVFVQRVDLVINDQCGVDIGNLNFVLNGIGRKGWACKESVKYWGVVVLGGDMKVGGGDTPFKVA
jgi:hypothetical protein